MARMGTGVELVTKTDSMSTEFRDMIGGCSNCCSAPMIYDMEICTDCKEPCSDTCSECGTEDDVIEGLCPLCTRLIATE